MQLGTDEVDDSQGPPHMFDALTKVLVRRTDDNATHVATARKDVGGRRSDAILPVELAMMGARGFPVEESRPRVPCSSPALSNVPSRYLFYAVCSIYFRDGKRRRDLVQLLGFWFPLVGEGQIILQTPLIFFDATDADDERRRRAAAAAHVCPFPPVLPLR